MPVLYKTVWKRFKISFETSFTLAMWKGVYTRNSDHLMESTVVQWITSRWESTITCSVVPTNYIVARGGWRGYQTEDKWQLLLACNHSKEAGTQQSEKRGCELPELTHTTQPTSDIEAHTTVWGQSLVTMILLRMPKGLFHTVSLCVCVAWRRKVLPWIHLLHNEYHASHYCSQFGAALDLRCNTLPVSLDNLCYGWPVSSVLSRLFFGGPAPPIVQMYPLISVSEAAAPP